MMFFILHQENMQLNDVFLCNKIDYISNLKFPAEKKFCHVQYKWMCAAQENSLWLLFYVFNSCKLLQMWHYYRYYTKKDFLKVKNTQITFLPYEPAPHWQYW